MLCYAMLCYAMLCYAMLCYAKAKKIPDMKEYQLFDTARITQLCAQRESNSQSPHASRSAC